MHSFEYLFCGSLAEHQPISRRQFWKQLKGLWLQAPCNEVMHLNERQRWDEEVHFTQISKHYKRVEVKGGDDNLKTRESTEEREL